MKKLFLTILASKGPPFGEKIKNVPKNFFFTKNHTFSFWICIVHVLSFLLMYITLMYQKKFNFDIFLHENFHFSPWSFDSQIGPNYSLWNAGFGVYGQPKIKKVWWKSFLGFRMPTDSLRMARIHPGHNGPPPLSNVIPEPAQNRVKAPEWKLIAVFIFPDFCPPTTSSIFNIF